MLSNLKNKSIKRIRLKYSKRWNRRKLLGFDWFLQDMLHKECVQIFTRKIPMPFKLFFFFFFFCNSRSIFFIHFALSRFLTRLPVTTENVFTYVYSCCYQYAYTQMTNIAADPIHYFLPLDTYATDPITRYHNIKVHFIFLADPFTVIRIILL